MKMMKRSDILAALSDKARNDGWHDRYMLAWNVKVYSFDDSGIIPGDYHNDPRFNDKWGEYKKVNDESLWEYAATCWWDDLDLILEGHPDPSLENVTFDFAQFGRSGGWLGLRKFDGYDLTGRYTSIYEIAEEMPYLTLWALYKFTLEVDAYVNGRYEYLAYLYADQREQLEMEWADEANEDEARQEEFFGAM